MLEHRIITIETGRDAGKVYKVTEMPASKLEKWAARALLALFAGDVPADVVQMARGSNAAALVGNVMSGLGSLRWEDVEPLYDELLTCVARVPDPGRPEVVVPLVPANIDAHVQDVTTLWRLRAEALELCFGFFGIGGGLSSRLRDALHPQASGTTKGSRPA